jgi:hypothetical protein
LEIDSSYSNLEHHYLFQNSNNLKISIIYTFSGVLICQPSFLYRIEVRTSVISYTAPSVCHVNSGSYHEPHNNNNCNATYQPPIKAQPPTTTRAIKPSLSSSSSSSRTRGERLDTNSRSGQRFYEEIKGLADVLQSLSHSLERADSQQRPCRAYQHWRNVRTSISDCKRSLESFQTILDGIKVDERHLFAKPLQQGPPIHLTETAAFKSTCGKENTRKSYIFTFRLQLSSTPFPARMTIPRITKNRAFKKYFIYKYIYKYLRK